jgi:hypothetical protein
MSKQRVVLQCFIYLQAIAIISCGADQPLQSSSLKQMKTSSSAPNLASSTSMVRVNSFGRGLNILAFPGRRVKSESCLYSMSKKLNVCVGSSMQGDNVPAPSDLDKTSIETDASNEGGAVDDLKTSLKELETVDESESKGIFGSVDDRLDEEVDKVLDLIDGEPKVPKQVDFALDHNRFEVGSYSLGLASMACLQPVSGSVKDRVYVFGAEIPTHVGGTCFTSIACSKNKVSEVNVGMRLCDPNITTEIALSYDAEKRKLGLYVKGSVDADDLNFRLLMTDQGVLLEYVSKDLDSGSEILSVNSLKLTYEDLRPIADIVSEHFKKLGICRF